MEDSQHDYASLLAKVRGRDAAAAEELVEALYPVAMKVIRRRVPPGADPRDLAQDVLLRVLQGLPSFRGDGAALPAWVRRIAFRTCLNEWRRRKSRPELVWSDLTEEQIAGIREASGLVVQAEVGSLAVRELVGLLLDQLQPEERLVVELSDLEERELGEIRALTGWSALNIRVRRYRARQKMARWLDKLREEGNHED